jgi:hypothetical protein
MRVKLQLVLCSEDGREETVTDIVSLNKDSHRIEHLGLTLAESKQLLKRIQEHLLEQHIDRFLETYSQCPDCGATLKAKRYTTRSFRTLFGTFKLPSPRLLHCTCRRRKTTSFRPLSALLTESVSPELLFMESKWSSLASYGLTVKALKDFLPLDATLAINTVRHDTLKVADRLEAELGEERWSFIDGCPREWAALPIPDGPITVGIDGGYVRDWDVKKRHFEVIVGKSLLALKRDEEDEMTPSSKRFGFVQTEDTKSKRRLFEVLTSQGFQLNQQITFLSDGEDAVRNLQLYMSPEAEHILDWWHVTQRLTVLDQYGKGLVHCDPVLGESIREKIERLKWSLWNGNVYKALDKIDDIESLIYNFEETYPKFKQLVQAVEEFRTYIQNNAHLIPNYGERYRHGEAITTSFVESTENEVVSTRFCKKQQMQWSKEGAHLLLQTRVQTLNGDLSVMFKRWYPDMDIEVEEMPAAA